VKKTKSGALTLRIFFSKKRIAAPANERVFGFDLKLFYIQPIISTVRV
jgi:hypothetical protein